MDRVVAALKRAGVEDRDIQTSNINLNPEYTYANNQPPKLNGYTASNQLTIRFRDIANSGKILDALVAEGANQINGPKPDDRQARGGARRGRAQERSPSHAHERTSTPVRLGCAWSAWSQ